MLFLETFSTMGKTGMYEGVHKKTKGLSVRFNIKCEHYKQIVGSPTVNICSHFSDISFLMYRLHSPR